MPLATSMTKNVDFIVIGERVTVCAVEEDFHSILAGYGSGNGLSIKLADERLNSFMGVEGFDPRPILKNMESPILWFFGTKDDVIPVNASMEVLDKMNKNNLEIILLPIGDHNVKNY
ncbi:MAG: hypothetical protein ACX93O_16285 [Flagellimonas sp.]